MADIADFLDFIKQATSPYHTADIVAQRLHAAGFRELSLTQPWDVKIGDAVFVRGFDTSIFAFTLGEEMPTGDPRALRLAAAHTDFPGFRVKPIADRKDSGCLRLNVEAYGGLINESWLDRPLSLAGMVTCKGDDPLEPKRQLIDFRRPVLLMPRLAIHMNRKANEGQALNRQDEMQPIASLLDGHEDDTFLKFLAEYLHVDPQAILSYDLNVYAQEHGEAVGLRSDFLLAPRLDNLTSAYACLVACMATKGKGEGIHAMALFDNEEVGNQTKQGAGSLLFLQVMKRLYKALGRDTESLFRDAAAGLMLSVDAAHGLHPNYAQKADPTNRPLLGKGVVLKRAASQSYANDPVAVAVVQAIADKAQIPVQEFANRSDMRGGGTLGSALSTSLPMRALDIGVPLWAMHSARETMGTQDEESLWQLIEAFYKA